MPAPDQNTHRCYPVYSGWAGRFVSHHKYLATAVAVNDLTGGGPSQLYRYDLSVAPAVTNTAALWAYDQDDSLPSNKRSWSLWRGYAKVTTSVGPDGGTKTVTDRLYYRGMDQDRTATGTRSVAIYTVHGDTLTDEPSLQGVLREEASYDGATVATSTIHKPTATLTVTNTRPWYTTKGWRVRETETRTRTWRAHAGAYRWKKTTTGFDSYGQPTAVTEHGDEAVTGDETCTGYSYARDTTKYLIEYPSETSTRAGTDCAAGNRLALTHTFDDGTTTSAPHPPRACPRRRKPSCRPARTCGRPPIPATTATAGSPRHRRPGQETTTAYTPATGGPVRQVTTTNPLGHTTVTTLDGRRGTPVTVQDPNGKTTSAVYDPLGRLTKVWRPGRPTTGVPDVEYGYTLRGDGRERRHHQEAGADRATSSPPTTCSTGGYRTRQTQAPAPAAHGGRIVTDVAYDPRGLAGQDVHVPHRRRAGHQLVVLHRRRRAHPDPLELRPARPAPPPSSCGRATR